MKRSERRKFISKLFADLNWLKSKENADRMEYKGIIATGIAQDAAAMIFDFAEKENISLIQLLDWLVLGIAMQRGNAAAIHGTLPQTDSLPVSYLIQ